MNKNILIGQTEKFRHVQVMWHEQNMKKVSFDQRTSRNKTTQPECLFMFRWVKHLCYWNDNELKIILSERFFFRNNQYIIVFKN